MDDLHYNDVPPDQVDQALLTILPIGDGHLFFNGIVQRYRESIDWQVSKHTGGALVHDGLKRLGKRGLVLMGNHPNSPLFYKKLPCT
jgi:hypothetical protein